MNSTDDSTYVQSLNRGLSVIRAFDAEHPRQTLADIARATGLTRATARRFLLTLERLGYVRSTDREFSLTPRVLELGFSYLSALSLPALAQPHLERLSQEVGESTSASVLDGDDIVYIARVPTRRIMSVSITIGTRFPAYVTAMGRVLLAALPNADRAEYLRTFHGRSLTARTLTDPARLAIELDQVAQQGWCLVDQELEAGLRSIAAPVAQADRIIAAINISATTGTTVAELHDRALRPLLAAAAAITAELDLLPT